MLVPGLILTVFVTAFLAWAAWHFFEPGPGQTILFEPMALRGKAAAVYKLKLRGAKVGTGQVRIEVSASGLAAPVRREMTARVR